MMQETKRLLRLLIESMKNLCNQVRNKSPKSAIIVSESTTRKDCQDAKAKITELNKMLKSYSAKNGIILVSHSNITGDALNTSGLHFNQHGTVLLARNFINSIKHFSSTLNQCLGANITPDSTHCDDINVSLSPINIEAMPSHVNLHGTDLSDTDIFKDLKKLKGFRIGYLNITSLTKYVEQLRFYLQDET